MSVKVGKNVQAQAWTFFYLVGSKNVFWHADGRIPLWCSVLTEESRSVD
jgi:hypothetical protein